ncbi:MAG: tail fiber domain-containing protein [Deltaproteobacteria bacterium]|nr:tail fiber domain-containing protein [Deltaproteobacteria bacterium]
MHTTTTKLTIIAALLLFSTTAHAAGTAINETGETPHASAILDALSTTKGFLPPRMTEAQRGAIASPATGLQVYQTDGTAGLYVYNGTAWNLIGNATGTVSTANGGTGSTDGSITGSGALTFTAGGTGNVTLTPGTGGYTLLGGNVGIGTATPTAKLDISASGEALRLIGDNNFLTFYNTANTVRTAYIQQNAGTNLDISTNGLPLILNQNGGNVGIGTTTPASKLHIAGADMNNALLFENTSANPGRNYILFKTQGTEQGYIGLGGGATNHMSVAAYGASNNLFLETNGTVKMTVLPSGNVGIGTTTPAYKLHIQDATSPALAIQYSTNSDYPYLSSNASNDLVIGSVGSGSHSVFKSNGNVGIGTTTPYTTLTVGSTDATARITAGGPNTHLTLASAGPNGDIYLNAGGVASGNYSTSTRLTVGANGNVGIGTTTPVSKLHVNGDISIPSSDDPVVQGGMIRAVGLYGSVTNIPSAIEFRRDNGVYTGEEGQIRFKTTNVPTATPPDRMVILGNGNVGIGTTTPGSPLHIKGVGESYTLRLESTTTVGPGIRFHGSESYDGKNWTINAGGSGNPFGANKFVIYDETAGQARMTINTDGNVGIGTTTPDVKLKVVTNVADYTAGLSNTLNSTGSMGLFISNGSNSTGGATMVGFYRPDGTMLGSIGQSGAASVAYNTTSDYRLKDNIVNTHFSLNDLMKIQVRDYFYKADSSKTPVTGFIAQELYEIFPNAVSKPANEEEMWSVDYGKVTPLLVKGMQDLKAENDELKSENGEMKKENSDLKARLEKIEKVLGL